MCNPFGKVVTDGDSEWISNLRYTIFSLVCGKKYFSLDELSGCAESGRFSMFFFKAEQPFGPLRSQWGGKARMQEVLIFLVCAKGAPRTLDFHFSHPKAVVLNLFCIGTHL